MTVRAVFANAPEQREVASGETVFTEGDTRREMFGLISGGRGDFDPQVRMRRRNGDCTC
jgi:hypothetical protein